MEIRELNYFLQSLNRAASKYCVMVATLCLFQSSYAQDIWESRRGFVRTQANLAPGLMQNQPRMNAYIAGDMDIFLDDQFSFAGSAWYSFSTIRNGQTGVTMNHSIFWGGSYHWLDAGRFDPYLTLQPGFGVARANYLNRGELATSAVDVVPLVSVSIGCNYYVGSMFHFLFRLQAVSGHLSSDMPQPMSLNELRCSVGLGYNLRAFN